jgi:kynurenine formamidase
VTDTEDAVLAALRLARAGKIVSLAKPRFRGMPNLPGHATFDIVSYRTPHGLRVADQQPLTPSETGCSGFSSELILGSAHTGAHIDALGHVTAGEDDHWHGGGVASQHLGDFGPTIGDAAALAPIVARGVLLDIARLRAVDVIGAGEAITATEFSAAADAAGVRIEAGDVVLVRTGYLSRWPDHAALDEIRGAGPDLSAAQWLVERRVRATGADTESYEVLPLDEPRYAFPVHRRLIVEHGIHIMESLDLEELAVREVTEFLFVALPLKIQGATGSMIDPVAIY